MINKCFLPVLILVLGVGPLPVASAALPDLIPNAYRLKRTVQVQKRNFPVDHCAYVEGCLRGPNIRKLLLFDTGVANVGKADLIIGDPDRLPNLFTFSPCHNHYHMKGVARYRLFTVRWRLVGKALKQGFCLRDDQRYLWTAGPGRGYTCDYQGISRGWQDVYGKSLDCQWMDVTGVPPGKYYLEVVVNPNRALKESNHRNNRVIIPIVIPRLAP